MKNIALMAILLLSCGAANAQSESTITKPLVNKDYSYMSYIQGQIEIAKRLIKITKEHLEECDVPVKRAHLSWADHFVAQMEVYKMRSGGNIYGYVATSGNLDRVVIQVSGALEACASPLPRNKAPQQ